MIKYIVEIFIHELRQNIACIYVISSHRLFLYTDGLTDVTDPEWNLYGEERVIQSINKDKNLSGQQVIDALLDDIDTFRGDMPEPDDITMLLFEV